MHQIAASNSALYLPAVSDAYLRLDNAVPFKRPCPVRPSDLNFLDLTNRYLHYPYALYSAGQGAKSRNSINRPHLFENRDRARTVLVADSGGFQIQQGTIRFEGVATTRRLLRWMEKNGDYAMTLDFPTGGISTGTAAKHTQRLIAEGYDITSMTAQNGFSPDYNGCLTQTCINNEVFASERVQGATNILNVLQGRNEEESKHWYEAVKHFPFEGWSLAGGHQTSFYMVLNRIFDLAADGLLQKANWLHILGRSTLWAAALYTELQRGIRERFNPNFTVSFDSASPFIMGSKFVIYTGFVLDRFGWNFTQENINSAVPSERKLTLNAWSGLRRPPGDGKGPLYEEMFRQREWTPATSAIGMSVTVSDLFGINNSGVDTIGVQLLMNHNLDVFLQGIKRANELFHNRTIDFIPHEFLRMKILIEKAFETGTPSHFVNNARQELDALAHL